MKRYPGQHPNASGRTCPGTDPPPSAPLRGKRELCLQNQRCGSGGHAHGQPAGGEVWQVLVEENSVPERGLTSPNLKPVVQAAFIDCRDQDF